ncbi:MAG: sulfite exporter TauE/SafE family protein [Nitrospirae bacterium]|nr:sulfite exporter TauE/SafE family protein [Nitrospirota bacterium]MBF0534382.1 sulfite exporter TauE/SafE family protein [Nitrospirota bacterium]MBF0615637.1 sulfite exporter TauE/SafE family protein [Nitrospirota bacterium]
MRKTILKLAAVIVLIMLITGCARVLVVPQHLTLDGFLDVLKVVVVGVFVGFLGTMIGAGGGFLLVPILLIFYKFTPQHAIGTSTAVVFLNALSGTFSYIDQKRIDYELGVKFSVIAVVGVIIGAFLTQALNFLVFSVIFSVLLIALSYSMIFMEDFSLICEKNLERPKKRVLYDSYGQTHTYAPDLSVGFGGSFIVGILSGLLGIGGGLLHVPLMGFIGIPIHVAAATSHFIIVITSFFGVLAFIGFHTIDFDYAIFIGVGTILGALFGAKAAKRTNGEVIKKIIAFLLIFMALKLLLNLR